MLGLNRHRPPLVVFAFTVGALAGYSDEVNRAFIEIRSRSATFGELNVELGQP